jgi:hypothetical protein
VKRIPAADGGGEGWCELAPMTECNPWDEYVIVISARSTKAVGFNTNWMSNTCEGMLKHVPARERHPHSSRGLVAYE